MSFKWRIYYEDGSTFSDADGKPQDSPPWGAVVVAQPRVEPKQQPVLVGANADYFLYNTKLRCWHQVGETEVEGGLSVGLVDHLAHFAHQISCVRPARWMVNNEKFKQIWAQAREDVDA